MKRTSASKNKQEPPVATSGTTIEMTIKGLGKRLAALDKVILAMEHYLAVCMAGPTDVR